MASPQRPVMSFDQAMAKAQAREAAARGTTREERAAAGIPSTYHVEVYLQVGSPGRGARHAFCTFRY